MGAQLRRLRVGRGLSLEGLARASGVSRTMISEVERGRSTPTVTSAWRIAQALGVPFSALVAGTERAALAVLREAEAKVLASHDGVFRSRALFPFDGPRRAELYELRLAPGGTERAAPHAPGTVENLVVHTGTVEIEVGAERALLGAGDAILFEADAPHAYRNPGSVEASMYLVMTESLD